MSELRETVVPRSKLRRMLMASFGQAARTPRCPETPRLDGKLAVVTGATGGIGLEIARGLARRGAEVIAPCRDAGRGDVLLALLRAESSGAHRCVQLDLEDLESARACAAEIARLVSGRPIDVLIENAGLWPQQYRKTRQGNEIAFGTNVLGHFALRRALQDAGLLPAARAVVLTGDIYVLESDCTPDFVWKGPRGGMRAYCRSKLGNLWIASELQRRFPALTVAVAHPGVVATNLGGSGGVIGELFRRQLMLTPEQGAQMPLWCATQPGIEKGGYYHNVLGRMRLDDHDAARDSEAARRLWEVCERLSIPS